MYFSFLLKIAVLNVYSNGCMYVLIDIVNFADMFFLASPNVDNICYPTS